MQLITSITNEPKQNFTLRLDNNQSARMKLYFFESQKSWYYDIEYNGKENNGNKVVLTFNAIRHLRKIFPFGISFVSVSNAEPFSLDAFTSGQCMMLLLNADDVQEIEDIIYNESAK